MAPRRGAVGSVSTRLMHGGAAGGPRVSHMAVMLLELKRHIQQTYPYWNRTQVGFRVVDGGRSEMLLWSTFCLQLDAFPTHLYMKQQVSRGACWVVVTAIQKCKITPTRRILYSFSRGMNQASQGGGRHNASFVPSCTLPLRPLQCLLGQLLGQLLGTLRQQPTCAAVGRPT
jgi:hypothetical protein